MNEQNLNILASELSERINKGLGYESYAKAKTNIL
jgi:hypothetical protein